MKKIMSFVSISSISLLFFFVSTEAQVHEQLTIDAKAKLKLDFVSILSEPVIREDFAELKKVATNASLYQKEGKTYLSEKDLKKLDRITIKLEKRIHDEYHVDPNIYKAHSYVGQYQLNSCYQYYNSFAANSVGKDCAHFQHIFSTCGECNAYIQTLNKLPANHIIQSHWWKNEKITALVESLTLKNGDKAYVGFELSPKK
ncbi:hypothetical protein BH10PSE19_BH10PSE19_00970 [soil metagenome]